MQKFEKWTETYEQLVKADQQQPLPSKELERLALSAYLTGRDDESFQTWERAHESYLAGEKTELAVRCAFWLGLMLVNAGQVARSSGWFARGERLLNEKQIPECAEQGLLLIPSALGVLAAGDSEKALQLFVQATRIGEHFNDADLMALGRLGQGQALIQQGRVAEGIKWLDEMMITVASEKVFPIARGIIYCAVIETCRKVWDLGRAQEWTSTLTRWCEAHPEIVPFRGQCLVRRAEIIQFHGEWHKALEETNDACALLSRPPGEPAAGEAYYRKAELHRLLGAYEAAEDGYREAAKWGKKPQPGLALLRLAQGQDDAAETSIRNTLLEAKNPAKRAELLPAVVTIMIAVKQNKEAAEAANELSRIATQFDTPYLHAIADYCQGAVLLAEGKSQQALEHLQKALKLWEALQLPYESAHTRELIGQVYRVMKDKDNSEVELAAAQWVFEQLKAMPDLERISGLLKSQTHHKSHGLTLREIQVLYRVAKGKTNKYIAGELFISERTVDRHVSNIFNKLNVSSRAEATAFALKHKILDDAQ